MAGVEIAENLKKVRERIARAARKAGRNPSDMQLVAVSKTAGVEAIDEAIEAGVTILGESYIQEAKVKMPAIACPVRWDFIGHLQSNKARHAVGIFEMIHSVDSLFLAQAINRIAMNSGKSVRVLVEVNISGEKAKSGIDPAGTSSLVREIASLSNLSLEGLMTMAPYSDDPEKSRPYFRALRHLRDTLHEQHQDALNLRELSMGMSSDFEIAIEEGATLIRVGTAIFGERP